VIVVPDHRKCNECGTRYTPPAPAGNAVALIVLGCLLAGGGLFLIVALEGIGRVLGVGAGALGLVLFIYGIRRLTKRPPSKELVLEIPAPLSKTVQTAMYASGVVCLLGAALAGLVWLGTGGRAGFGGSFSTFLQLGIGVALLRSPSQIQQLREKRLKEYQEFAPPGAPPPVEKSRGPDVVVLGGLFGLLSLVSVAVVFGPAAIVCGIVALAQGHLKGLIGMALGVAGLIGWGVVFVYLFQG
jgi:hypothetical protein